MEANEPAYILATSGTTAKPKLAVHVHGGYQVHIVAMGRWVFGLRREDIFWATADIGWAVGHAYTVYAPLIIGATTVAFEGALDYPTNDAAWGHMARLGMTGIFTSPTAVRLLMRYGEAGARRHDLSRVERIVCAGEVLNPPAWEWLQKAVFDDRIPVIDNMWQTETGGPIFGNPYGIELMPIKPGSAGLPLPGIEAAIVNLEGQELPRDEKGIMVIRRPFPGLTPTLWGEPARYATRLLESDPGVVLGGRRRPHRRRRLRLLRRPCRRDHQDRRRTASARSRWRPRSCAIRRSPRPAQRVARTSCAAR